MAMLQKKHAIIPYLLGLFLLLLLDLGFSAIAPRLSGNLEHISLLPSLIKKANSSPGPKIIFLGNSLIGNGVSQEQVRKELKSRFPQTDLGIAKLVPDGTGVWDWFCVFNDQVLPRVKDETELVIGFAWNQLSDVERLSSKRLGGHFCEFGRLEELVSLGLTPIEGRIDFVLAKFSSIFRNQELLRKRILDLVIPFYRDETRNMNSRMSSSRLAPSEGVASAERISVDLSYTVLDSILAKADKAGVRITIVAMPILEEYQLDPKLILLLESRVRFLDFRNLDGLEESHFLDPIHLNAEGAKIFSQAISTQLELH